MSFSQDSYTFFDAYKCNRDNRFKRKFLQRFISFEAATQYLDEYTCDNPELFVFLVECVKIKRSVEERWFEIEKK